MGRKSVGNRGVKDFGSVYIGYRPRSPNLYLFFDGGRVRSLQTTDLRLATKRALKFGEFLAEESRPTRNVWTVAEALDLYFEEHACRIPSAHAAALDIKRLKEAFGKKSASDLSVDTTKSFVDAQLLSGRSLATASRTLATLRAALNYSKKRSKIDQAPHIYEPVDAFYRQSQNLKGRRLSDDEIARLIEATRTRREFLLLALLLGTMSRVGALWELKWDQIDRNNMTIRLNAPGRVQTKKRRPIVPLLSCVDEWLGHRSAGLVLPNAWGGPETNRIRVWNRLRDRACLDKEVTTYSIRHTVPSRLRRLGVPRHAISEMLGHVEQMAPARSTSRYLDENDIAHLEPHADTYSRWLREFTPHIPKSLAFPTENERGLGTIAATSDMKTYAAKASSNGSGTSVAPPPV